MKNFRKTIAVFINRIFNQKLRLGTKTYINSPSIPNSLSDSLNHEGFLDDIFSAALKILKGSVIDVGVNTGQTLLKILSIDKNRSYYGFEPQITAASCVEFFLAQNGINNCTILPLALSDHESCIPMYVRGKDIKSLTSSVSSIVNGFRPDNFYHQTKYIYAVQGDNIINDLNIDSIALIKIDVEGAELEVIRGLKNSLEKHHPIIVFEVLHHYLAVTNEVLDNKIIAFREARIQELEGIIRKNGYKLYQVDGFHTLTEIGKISPKFVNDLKSTDFVAVPENIDINFRELLSPSRKILNTR